MKNELLSSAELTFWNILALGIC